MSRNSIYRALGETAGGDSRKMAVAFIYSLIKTRSRRIISKDPIVDEAQNVYVGLDSIGRITLHSEEGEQAILGIVEGKLSENNYTPLEGTVEEVVLGLYNQKGLEKTLEIVGDSLKEAINQRDFGKPVKEIRAGKIPRYEQRAIRKKLSEYLE